MGLDASVLYRGDAVAKARVAFVPLEEGIVVAGLLYLARTIRPKVVGSLVTTGLAVVWISMLEWDMVVCITERRLGAFPQAKAPFYARVAGERHELSRVPCR